ncbi:5'-3' exonuclease [Candidatus Mycoplasma haematohominis]|uniref:5'-3' exonuclease n=1 Tax=Candidatus Mycoplasma haematohominis TaxID=1494318 RepID=UPI001C0A6FE3|nr:5'-3' exonuclease H3TH domain-containing protein [Candidatus Mycoplasma haemohominis]
MDFEAQAIVLDGNSIMYRAYYATQKGKEEIKAEKEFAATLEAIRRTIKNIAATGGKYKYGVVAFDSSRKTFRREKFSEYKSNRISMPIPLANNLNKIRNLFIKEGFVIVDAPFPYEGDDVIATIIEIFSSSKVKTLVFSTDRDLLQLVGKYVSVCLFKPMKPFVMHTEENFESLNDGLKPNQIPFHKALSGDSSDNYKGLSGIGPITATSWLIKYGDIDNLYKNLDDLKPKQKQTLLDNKETVSTFLELALLVRNIDLSNNLKNYEFFSNKVDETDSGSRKSRE